MITVAALILLALAGGIALCVVLGRDDGYDDAVKDLYRREPPEEL